MKRPWFINYWIGAGIWEISATSIYWILWFTTPELIQTFPPQSPLYPGYVTFEQAFLMADCWLILSSFIFVIGLWKMRDWGLFFGLLNAGSLVFLGSMDLLYDLQHSVFMPFTVGGAIELFIVLSVFGINAFNLIFFWKNRGSLIEVFFADSMRRKAPAREKISQAG